MYWIDLELDRDQWRALVNTAVNLWIPTCVAVQLVASQELNTMELVISKYCVTQRK
jgi:hypothetical protein